METLNEARLSVVLQQYLENGQILSPPEANEREPVFMGENWEAALKHLNNLASWRNFGFLQILRKWCPSDSE